ncbi:non-ribosomal peptide synthase/polyketide synthase [Janthinobacterium lividum]|uniref:non-ribosomal peptide synthetase n=1 Tax=Janthinobacterium lividum TaxID=29581 RepID=UPI0015951126|nr:non-ribosomal peptide synthase/polyketide synthase [Janthinobacterium lividum]QKY12021.1 amino acid adenylation domain-containing protein [Janthinobacterium lividum]
MSHLDTASEWFPLSSAQRSRWFLYQLDDQSRGSHNNGFAVRLHGAVDAGAIGDALNELAARHAMLRVSFRTVDGEPEQKVCASVSVPVHAVSAQNWSGPALQQQLRSACNAPFDLAHGALVCAHIYHIAAAEAVLLLVFDHLVCDGWSYWQMLSELGQLLADPAAKIPVSASQEYRDYIEWQRTWVDSAAGQSQWQYWQKNLGTDLPILQLAADRSIATHAAEQNASFSVFCSDELTVELRALAQTEACSLFVVLLTAYQIVLHRHTGQDDIVVGTPMPGRSQVEWDRVIGDFVNPIAIRTSFDGQPSVKQLLSRVRSSVLRGMQHQDYPFDLLVERLQPTRHLTAAPIFQTMFTFQKARHAQDLLALWGDAEGTQAVQWGGFTASSYPMHQSGGARDHGLALEVIEIGGTLRCDFRYNAALFDAASIERFAMHFQNVLRDIGTDHQAAVSALSMLDAGERQHLLVGLNDTSVALTGAQLLHQRFEEQARLRPEAVALVHEGHSLSYAVLNERANRLAHHLISMDVRVDCRVAICTERGVDMIVALLATLKAGGAYVPLDPSYPAERLAFMLADSEPVVLIVQAAVIAVLPAVGAAAMVVLDDPDEQALIARQPADNPDPQALGLTPDHLAYVIYTSGSTGKPKGVMNQHRSICNFGAAQVEIFGVTPASRVLQFASLSFDASLMEITMAYCAGASLYLGERDTLLPGEPLVRMLQTQGITHTLLPASALAACGAPEQLAPMTLILGGDVLPAALARQWAACHQVFNAYGPTEAAICAATFRCHTALQDAVPIGRPVANVAIYLLDAGGQPVPQGVVGELYIGGAGVARGYLNRPELTAQRFVADPFSSDPDARLYKTGDLGRYLADGNIVYLGRNDFQVKLRGFRIELGEIEACLQACEGVREALVVAREDHAGEKRLVAYVVADSSAVPSTAALRTQLLADLPNHMVPSAFMILDAFPLTSNGKLDRRALPAPDQAAVPSRAYAAPEGDTEVLVAQIWQELLGVERVGRHDHFFELGGHSLLAMRMLSRVREQLGAEVAVRELFKTPVLSGFASAVANAGVSALEAIVPADRSGPLPLSWAQQRLWFLDQLDHAASAAYHMAAGFRLSGTLDRAALQATFDCIVARHESLRTRFILRDGVAVQEVAAPDTGLPLHLHALEGLHGHELQSAIERIGTDEASTPFDLAQGPLIRGRLLRLGEQEHILFITQHHIISDGWSIGVLVREVCTLYAAFSQGQANPLPALAIQYPDYAAWQRQWLQGEALQAQLAFWRTHLHGAPALLAIPTDRPRPARQSHAGETVRISLDAPLTAGVRSLGQQHGTTLFMSMLAAWSLLLSRLSGQDDVVIGSPIANRQRGETEGLIGFFANTLALRVQLQDDPTVAAVLAQVKATTLAAYAHQDLPFEQVVEAVNPARSMAHSPLFQAMLTLDNTPGGGQLALPGLQVQEVAQAHTSALCDLMLTLSEQGDTLGVHLTYASDLYDGATMLRLLGYLQTLLASMVRSPQCRLSELTLLGAEERAQLLALNPAPVAYPQQHLVHQLFARQAAAQPEAVALRFAGQSLSYAALNRRANQLAHALLARGVQRDARVAICSERSVEMVVAILAVLKAGAAYVPLDPAYPRERLAYMYADSAPALLLTQSWLQHGLPAGAQTLYLDQVQQFEEQPQHDPAIAGLNTGDLAYVIYTSGSTGRPKGVMIEHGNVLNLVHWALDSFEREELAATVLSTSINFDLSVYELFAPLACGASVTLVQDILAAPAALVGSSLINTVPSAAQALLGMGGIPASVRSLNVAGEPLKRQLAERLLNETAVERLCNLYGPTETTTYSTWVRMDRGTQFVAHIGVPVANTQVYILDGALGLQPLGVVGEIYIGGAGVTRGYLNQEELTRARYVPDPFSALAGARLYKTGDLGRWLADGNIEYLGRNDFQVKVRGFRIELGEIEAALLGCAGVREAVVLARTEEAQEVRLVAYVVAEAGQVLAVEPLRAQLAQSLAAYMVPGAFVLLDALPLTPNGKLDREALPAPDLSAVHTCDYAAPQGDTEVLVAQIWQELLGVERVGRHDDFFALGGHSLLAVQVISRLRQCLDVEVDLGELFASPVLASFARAIDAAVRPALDAIAPADRSAPLPLSWPQQRLWFLDQLDHAASAAYHMAAGFRLSGTLDRAALQATFDCIVARHESLRTRFILRDGVAVQEVAAPDTGLPLHLHALEGLHGHELQSAIERIGTDEASTPFDLAQGPLIRGRLLRLGEQEHILFITQHHIISDGWSIGVLVREVCTLYAAFSQGQANPLPALAIQYPDYAAWQRQWLQGEALQAQLAFWRTHLHGAPALLAIPTDRPRPARQSHAGETVRISLDAPLTAGVRSLGQQHGTTLFMSMLAAWSLLLSRLSGQDDVVIGSPIANRQRGETEGLIGFFANTLALRVQLQDDPTVAAVLAQVKATTLAAYAHQDLPFEQVVEAVNPARSMAHSPLFQAMLTLDNTPGGGQLALPGLQVQEVAQAHTSALCDLMLTLSEQGDTLGVHLTYASDLYDGATMLRLLGYLQTLLASMVRSPQCRLSELTLLGAEERAQLLALNPAPVAYPQQHLVHQLFARQAAAQPEAVALRFAGQSLSYAALNRRANQLAHALLARGVQRDARVAICSERSVEMVVAILAVLKAGAAYVPLDPAYPRERLAYMYADSAPALLLTQSWLQHGLPAGAQTLYLDQVQQFEEQPQHDPAIAGLNTGDLAYVIYTSGSTGRPKGVMIEHGNVLNLVHWALDSFEREELAATVLSTSINFDLSVYELFAPLACGASVTLVQDILAAPAALVGSSLINTVPSAAQALLGMGGIPASVRSLNVAGEPLKRQLAERLLNETAVERLCNLYGPTETTTYSTWVRMDRGTQFVAHIGVPVANTQVYILDGALGLQPLGVVGEIYIGGAGVTRGYLNQEELTQARYVPDPFSALAGARLYKTGDLGRWLADGNIEYLGRNDFQVKVRGFRIELGEIEAALLGCAGVREAVVLARTEEAQEVRLVAYVVAEAGQVLAVEPLRAQLAQSLAAYMVPGAFVLLDALPLTPNGKLDREALPAPDLSSLHTFDYAAPEGDTEVLVAQIWQELLGVERVGRHDDFFALGGHSLLAVQVISRLRERLGVEVAIRALFNDPTLSRFASAVADAGASELSAIVPADRSGPLPLSWAQQRLWFLDQLEGGSAQYNMPMALLVRGDFSETLAQQAFTRIIERHEPLRTVFASSGTQPVQVIRKEAHFSLTCIDLRGLDATQQEDQVHRAARADAVAAFDLSSDVMLRASFLRRDDESGVLLFNMHHIASDGWSMGLLFNEFLVQYDALAKGQDNPLPPMRIHYADYAQWQRAWLVGEVLERQLHYWEQQLADLPTVHSIPLDRPRPALQRYRGANHIWTLDRTTHQALTQLARERGVTMFMLLHGALSVLLARHGNSGDIVIGTPVANRRHKAFEEIIGYFANTLVLRSDCSGNPRFIDFLDAVKAVNLDAQSNQDVPFEYLVERLNPARSIDHHALFQVMFTTNTQSGDVGNAVALEHVGFTPVHDAQVTAKFDLAFNASETAQGIDLSINYSTDLFDAGTMTGMARHFDLLLKAIAAAPETPIHALAILDEKEQHHLLHALNATQRPFLQEHCIHELFEAQAAKTPANLAVVSGQERLSYSELNARANQLAHYLRAQGIGPDALVGLCVERGLDMMVGVMGILKAGAAYVPLDPGYPQDRLEYMAGNSAMTLLLTQEALLDSVAGLPSVQQGCTIVSLDGRDLMQTLHLYSADNCLRLPGQSSRNLAYVIYTSGSTGLPKGVMVEHRALVNRIEWMQQEYLLTPSDVVLQKTPFSFDVSVWELTWPFIAGASLVMAEPEGHKDPAYLCAAIQQHGVTTLHFVPSMLQAMLAGSDWPQCTSVRQVFCSGEALAADTVNRHYALHGAVLHNLYGPTEAAIDVSYWACQKNHVTHPVPIGKPIQNIVLHVLGEHRQLLPQGVAGELYIGGVGLARGYVNRPDLTAERFITNPFYDANHISGSERLYRTGDLVRYRADGNIEYLGRMDDQVKIRGIRIELGEIESRLAQHAQVNAALVLAREDVPGVQQLVAYVVATAESGADLAESLKMHLQSALPDYMVPAHYMVLETLPLTPNGKINKNALPAPDRGLLHVQHAAPQTDVERLLATIWADLLDLPVDAISAEANFFALGGHSLLVIQMLSRLQQAGAHTDVRAVFAAPNLAALAAKIKDTVMPPQAPFYAPPSRIPEPCARITPDMLPLIALQQEDILRIAAQVSGGEPNIEDIYPLAPLQEGILFHHLMQAQNDPYIMPILMSVDTPAQRDAVMAALQKTIDRHDVLRTAIVWQQLPQPVQVVSRCASLPVATLALDPALDVREQLMARMSAAQRMDLTTAPLLHASVAQDPHSPRCYIMLQLHHIISDHIGLEIIFSEVSAHLAGSAGQLMPVVSYREFVAHALHQARHNDAQVYFRKMLGDVCEPTAPYALFDVHGDGSTIVDLRQDMDALLARQIRQVARANNISPATLFHAAWAMVLAASSGRNDVVFGTVLSGRLQGTAGAAHTMGMFMNTLPVRLQLQQQSVLQFVRQTESALRELLPYEQTPLALAQRCSGLPSGTPLFSAMFNYRHSEVSAQASANYRVVQENGITLVGTQEKTNYPFTISVDDLGDGFAIDAQIDRSVDVTRVVGHLEAAMQGMVNALQQQPEQQILALSILPQPEQDYVLRMLNATQVDHPQDQLMHQLFEAQAAAQADATAVEHAGQRLSYGALNARANQLAHALLALGIVPDDRVAICAGRGIDMIVAMLGVLKAGAAYVPLDPAYPDQRLAYMLGDCAPAALLVDAALAPRLAAGAVPVLALQAASLAQQPEHNPLAGELGLQPGHLAYVIYTSGSTGLPKGVLLEHRQAVNFIHGQSGMLQLSPADRVLQFASFGFDSSVAEIFPALSVGATVVIRTEELMAPDHAFLAFLAAQRITVADLPTAFWHQWVQEVTHGRAMPPATLRTLVVSGEPAERRHLATWLGTPGTQGCRWINNYGPTEATVNATSIAYDAASRLPEGPVPIGRPVANAQVYVLDAQLQPVPPGVVGELYIGGAGVARGYLNRPELTAQRFIADPFSSDPAARLYRTGDLGRWLADGTLAYHGRNDFQVKLRGFRIELGEIEAQLVQCAGVREAVVLARTEETQEVRLVAYVVAEAGHALAVEPLRAQLAQSLAAYMVPGAFVLLDALPLTPNGKLDRRALPAPDQAAVPSRAYAAPEGDTETLIAQIWQELLGVERVGRHDHFFELGGHSLLAVQLLSRLRERLGVEVGLRDLFDAPVLSSFSIAVVAAKRAEHSVIVPADRNAPLPLSWAQQRLWFLDQLDQAAGAAYNSPTALRLKGTLDDAALQATLDSLLARHESLRTSFMLADGAPVQIIAPADCGFMLMRQDLSALDPAAQAQAISRIGHEEASQVFDLARGPLVRGRLLRMAQDEHALLLTVHHIVTDGWSTRVLVQEFSTLYAAYCAGEADPLLPLAIQYADYAVWQRGWLQGEELERQLDFWKSHLADAPALLALPTDRPRPPVQSYAGGQLAIELAPALLASLRTLSQRHGVSLFMTMLAGWSLLLARISGQDEVVVGTPIANRHRAETENLIGFFVNTLALRVSLDETLSVAQLLEQVKATTLAAYAHQDLPFEQVVEAIRPARSMDHSPVFQAMLTMNNVPERGELALPGLLLSDLGLERNTIHFDLHLTLTEVDEGIAGSLSYASDLFDASTAARLAQQFQTLLEGMVAAPGHSVLRLPLLDGAARQQVVEAFNATAAPLLAEQLLSTAFEVQVQAQPDAPAVVYGEQSLSYAQLNQRANLLAQRLLAHGVRPDDCVALCVERSVEMLVGIMGVWKAGAAYVPMDPANPADRLAYLLADSAPVAVLTQGALRARALPALAVPVLELDDPALQQGEAGNPDAAALGLTGRHLAYVIYTSGSTGAAKGVMVEHHSALNFWAVMRASTHQACPAQARIALNASYAFDMSLKGILQLLSGHCVHIVPQAVRSDGAQFLAFLAQQRIDAFDCTPSQLELLLAAGLLEAGAYQPGQVLIGGEAINAATWDKLRSAPGIAFFNMYGPTEATVDATLGRIEAAAPRAHIGRPVGNAQVYILDRLASRCRWACRASCISAAPAWRAATCSGRH